MKTLHYYAILLFSLVLLNGCKAGATPTPVSGSWKMAITLPDVGEMELIMHFETNRADSPGVYKLEAFSEEQATRKLLGTGKAMMANLFSKSFPRGSLVHLEGVYKAGDSISGILYNPIRNYYFEAVIKQDRMLGVLKDGAYKVMGQVKGEKGSFSLPLRNYKHLVQQVLAQAEDKLYDPAIVPGKAWQEFRKEMTTLSGDCNDDALLIMGFFYHARQLPFSHFALYRNTEDKHNTGNTESNVHLEEKRPGVFYMKITSFGGRAGEMDTAFLQITGKGCHTLIADLRDNPGGSVEGGLGFARHLVTDTVDGGVFLTQRYFMHHKELPAIADYRKFISFSDASFGLIIKGIHEQEGLCLRLMPQPPLYGGRLYVLVNGNTASTCEPVVYALKHSRRAVVVGERTAGSILNGETFDMPEGYKMVLPTAVYYTTDGVKLDGKGVIPDRVTDAAKALDEVMQEIDQHH